MAIPVELLTDVVNDLILGVLLFDRDSGECIYTNKLAAEILEFGFAGIVPLGYSLTSLVPQYAKRGHAIPFGLGLVESQGFSQDIVVRKNDGQVMVANVGVKHLTDLKNINEKKDYLLLMLQDVTYQKKLQRDVLAKQDELQTTYTEVLEQNRKLSELDRAKDKFIALTTHELRTPLSAIVSISDALVLGLEEGPEQRAELVRTMHEQALALMQLVNDILDFSKIRAGKMEYFIELQPLRDVIKKVVDGFQAMALKRGISIHIQDIDPKIYAYFDELRAREIFTNIISNAIKYNRDSGSIHIWVEVGAAPIRSDRLRDELVDDNRDPVVSISVRDTGLGIPKEKEGAVFSEFETVGLASRHEKGTGLGMPISRRLAEAMGGHLSFTSEVGAGTCFTVTFPQTKTLAESLYRSRSDAEVDLLKAS
jgi:signal transduction histidine kinase